MTEENNSEEQVSSVQLIENPRQLLEDLAASTSILRLVFDKPTKVRGYSSSFPDDADRIIKVFAQIHYEPHLSRCPKLIAKSRAIKENSITFVEITPKFLVHNLTYFWSSWNASQKLEDKNSNCPLIVNIAGDYQGTSITLSNGVNYRMFGKRNNLTAHRELFDQNSVEFNLKEFGWGDY